MPAMLRAGYNVKITAGVITAGGCLGILIPPSVMLIVYGAVAGVSVVQLYAGAFFPGVMLAGLYIGYVMILAKIRPDLAPPLPMSERHVDLPAHTAALARTAGTRVLPALLGALKGPRNAAVPTAKLLKELATTLMPAIVFASRTRPRCSGWANSWAGRKASKRQPAACRSLRPTATREERGCRSLLPKATGRPRVCRNLQPRRRGSPQWKRARRRLLRPRRRRRARPLPRRKRPVP
jgi:hypothetical protein